MDTYAFFVFLHILLFVFWLGTDIGVFLAAKISERTDLGVETRATIMQLAMKLDRLPRTALTLILPSGLQLASSGGLVAIGQPLVNLAWLFGLIWAGLLWAGFLRPQTAIEARAMTINFLLNAALAVLVPVYAWTLFNDPATPSWLAGKVLLVGVIFVAGVVLDLLFKPAVEAFAKILADGASDELNARYSRGIGPVYYAVLAIYALVLVAAWLGVAKP